MCVYYRDGPWLVYGRVRLSLVVNETRSLLVNTRFTNRIFIGSFVLA